MTSLVDIAPSIEQVEGVDVPGISALGVATILAKHPLLRRVFVDQKVDPEQLMQVIPEAIADIIAAGTGHPGEEEHVKAAGRLGVERQLDFLAAIMRATLVSGIDPFLAKLNALSGQVGELGKVPVTKSPSQSKR